MSDCNCKVASTMDRPSNSYIQGGASSVSVRSPLDTVAAAFRRIEAALP